METDELSPRGRRIVESLEQLADSLESGQPIEAVARTRWIRVDHPRLEAIPERPERRKDGGNR